ncbi:MAG: M20/M25/M40 family metallo-hydrolase [Desulfobacterales bacterium]|nr:M20/M25/M40 family metallo-hydrolase [Desulfobacterales bacterium]
MEDHHREVLDLTQDLIRFRTTASRPGEIARCLDFVTAYLDDHGIGHRRLTHDGVVSILVPFGEGSPRVLLMSHLDVVEGPDAIFEPKIIGDRLFGRGSIDDKYAVALSLVLCRLHREQMQKRGLDPATLPFGLLITSDEETGGERGAKPALEAVRPDFCIALDGGSLDQIIVKEKGILRLRLVARGTAAHGARPWLGKNAIEALMVDYRNLAGLFDETSPDHWHRTLNLGIIRGGKAVNQVPDHAEAVLDIRYTETDAPRDLVAQIRGRVSSEVIVDEIEPLFYGGRSPFLDLLLSLSPDTITGFEHGASDARYLMAHGVPGIVWGPDGDLSQHSPEEHINLPSLVALFDRLSAFMTAVLEGEVAGP